MSALKADEEFESDKPETEATRDTDAPSAAVPAARSTQVRHAEFLEALQRAVEATRNVTNGFSPPDAVQRSALGPEDGRDEAPPVAPIDEQAASLHELAAPSIHEHAVPPVPERVAHERPAPFPERAAQVPEYPASDHAPPLAAPQPEPVPPPMMRWADRKPGAAAFAADHYPPVADVPKPMRPRPPRPLAERSPLDRPAWERPPARQQPSEVEAQRRRDEAVRRLKEYQRAPLPGLGAGYQPGRGRSWLGLAGRFGLVSAVVGAAAFFVVQLVGVNSRTPAGPTFWSGLVGGGDPAPGAAEPRLVLSELSGVTNRPTALGVNVEAAPSGGSILVQGLPPGSRITAGAAAGPDAWRVPIRELAHAAVVPPMNFTGMMTLTVDLRRADDSVADSDVLHVNWTPNAAETVVPKPVRTTTIGSGSSSYSPAQAAAPEPAAVDQPPAAEPRSNRAVTAILRQLDREEIANLLRRGQLALQNGDLSAARLLLNRAAEAGDAQAAMALGATYDPRVLRELRALGASADIDKARSWYQKAAEMGASEANQRLQLLAQQSK